MKHARLSPLLCSVLLLAGCGANSSSGTRKSTSTAPVSSGVLSGPSTGTSPSPSPSPSATPSQGTAQVSMFEPSSGHPNGGELVVISGSGFTDSTTVRFGSAQAQVLLRTTQNLVVVSPPGQGATTLSVQNAVGDVTTTTTSYRYVVPSSADDFHFRARTDKWWINCDYNPGADADNNGFGDLSDALQGAMNASGSLGFPGQTDEAERLLLSYLNQMYRNNPDGSPRTGGAPVSFQRTAPKYGSMPQTPGTSEEPQSVLDFNHMALRNVAYLGTDYEKSGTTGRATSEDQVNLTLQNDSGTSAASGNPLGCYADAMVYWWNRASIPASRRTLPELMEEFAALVAHEVGHSLGLSHNDTAPLAPATDNIMAATSIIGAGTNIYAFDEATWNAMLAWLPGSNRRVQRAAWTPRRLLAMSDAVVVATPVRLQGGTLDMEVAKVLAGDASAGFMQVGGFDGDTVVDKAQMAETGPCLMFLAAGKDGMQVDLGKASAVPLTGHDPEEWAALIAKCKALNALSGAEWQSACAEMLTGCLGSTDARIRADALVDLSTEPEVARGLTAAQTAQVTEVLSGARDAFERALAAQVLGHRADPSQVAALVAAGLGETDPAVLKDVAGALEQTLGLEAAAAAIRAKLAGLDDAGRARAAQLLGWLHDGQSVNLIRDALRSGDPAQVAQAADALGTMGAGVALADLEALAADAEADLSARLHALRAVGRIGGADAQAWLSEQAQALETQDLCDAARFARDFPQSFLLH